jgi:hypothetical protein
VEAYALEAPAAAFSSSRACFASMVSWLDGEESAGLTHGELEDHLQASGRNLVRQLVQDHLDLRAEREPRLAGVLDADQVPRDRVEAGRARWRRYSGMCAYNAWPTAPAPTPTCTPPMGC